MSINQVTLVGNITSDLELKATPNWHSVCSFSIATNRDVKKWEQWEKVWEFHNIVIWWKQAEFISKYAGKGKQLFIQGRLETRNWEDKETKKKIYRTEIVAEKAIITWNKNSNNNSNTSTNNTYSKPKEMDEEISIEDIPF